VTSRTVPEVCAECGGDMELSRNERNDDRGSFREVWHCPNCDKCGEVEGYEMADPATFEASGCCRD